MGDLRSPILLLKSLSSRLERILELVITVLLTHLIERLHHMLVPRTSAGRQLAALTTTLTLTTFHCAIVRHFVF